MTEAVHANGGRVFAQIMHGGRVWHPDTIGTLVSFGRAFLSNPDLVERLRIGAPPAPVDEATFYQGGDRGYLTYSAYQHVA